MPTRLLREGILDSDAVCSLSFPAEVFYRRLMSVVDDFGRFDGRAAVLKSRLYPLQGDKVREADIPRWIAECETAGLIVLYTVSAKPYILFRKLGVPRAKESKWPAPPPDLADENICAHMLADENGCEQTHASAPYSYSDSDSDSDSRRPPNPPLAGGGGGTGKKPRAPKATTEHRHFAAFWSAYPRKEARGNAVKAFDKIDPDDAMLAALLAAVEVQRRRGGCLEDRTTADGRSTIPHPASWLNGRRWEDAPPELARPEMRSSTSMPYTPYEDLIPKPGA